MVEKNAWAKLDAPISSVIEPTVIPKDIFPLRTTSDFTGLRGF